MPPGYFLKPPSPSSSRRRWSSPNRSSNQAKRRFILFKKNNVPYNNEKDNDQNASSSSVASTTSTLASSSEVVTTEEEEEEEVLHHPNNKRDDDNDTSREKCTQQHQQLSYKIDTYNSKRDNEDDGSGSSTTTATAVDDDYDAKSTSCCSTGSMGNDYIKTRLSNSFATKKVNNRQQRNRPAYPMLVPIAPPNSSNNNNNTNNDPSSSSPFNSPTNHNEFELFSIQIEMAKSAFLKSPWSHECWMDLVHSFRMENVRNNNDNMRMRCDSRDFHDDLRDATTENSRSSSSRISKEEEDIRNDFRSSSSSSMWADFDREITVGANNNTTVGGWSWSGTPIATTSSVIEDDDTGLDQGVGPNSALARLESSIVSSEEKALDLLSFDNEDEDEVDGVCINDGNRSEEGCREDDDISTSFPAKEGSMTSPGDNSSVIVLESSRVEFDPDASSMESLEDVSNNNNNNINHVEHTTEKKGTTSPNSATAHNNEATTTAMRYDTNSFRSVLNRDSPNSAAMRTAEGSTTTASHADSSFSEFDDPDSLSMENLEIKAGAEDTNRKGTPKTRPRARRRRHRMRTSPFGEFDPDSSSMESDDDDVSPPTSRVEDEDATNDDSTHGGPPIKLPDWPPRKSVMVAQPERKPRARIPKEVRRWEMESKVNTSRVEDRDAKDDFTPVAQPKFARSSPGKATISSSPTSNPKEARSHHVLNEVQHWEERIVQFDQRYVNIVAAALDDTQGVAWKVGQIVEVVPNLQEEILYVV